MWMHGQERYTCLAAFMGYKGVARGTERLFALTTCSSCQVTPQDRGWFTRLAVAKIRGGEYRAGHVQNGNHHQCNPLAVVFCRKN